MYNILQSGRKAAALQIHSRAFGPILNNVISEAWNEFGIVKRVNSSSVPWLIKAVKSLKRRSRFWERQRKKAKRNDGFVSIDGTIYSDECEVHHRRELRSHFIELSRVMGDCDSYTDRLLDSNIYGIVKRSYDSIEVGNHVFPL